MFHVLTLKALPRPTSVLTYTKLLLIEAMFQSGRELPLKQLDFTRTRIAAGEDTDEMERWLEREFDQPAAEALRKAISDDQLTSEDWKMLIRFLAVQILRTPAYYIRNLPRWREDAPPLLDLSMEETVGRLEAAKQSGTLPTVPSVPNSNTFLSALPPKLGMDNMVFEHIWSLAVACGSGVCGTCYRK